MQADKNDRRRVYNKNLKWCSCSCFPLLFIFNEKHWHLFLEWYHEWSVYIMQTFIMKPFFLTLGFYKSSRLFLIWSISLSFFMIFHIKWFVLETKKSIFLRWNDCFPVGLVLMRRSRSMTWFWSRSGSVLERAQRLWAPENSWINTAGLLVRLQLSGGPEPLVLETWVRISVSCSADIQILIRLSAFLWL